MKKGLLLPLSLVCLMTLVACGGKKPSSESPSEPASSETTPVESDTTPVESDTTPVESESETTPVESETTPVESETESETESEEPVTYEVTITNKADLQAEWKVGEADRSLALTISPEGNITALIQSGDITFATSDAAVATVMGKTVHAVGAGNVTITVNYHDASDSVDLTIAAKPTNKDKYGTDHEGTLEDPFTNEDAVKVGLWAKDNGNTTEAYYVTGVVDQFYHAPGSRTDGGVSFYLKPAVENGARFEVYMCYADDKDTPLTDDDIWVNGTIVAHGIITYYANGNQAETTKAILDSCEGNKPQPRQTIEATFAEVMIAGAALADGADSYDYYKFDAYVTEKSGNNYFLTATKGEELVKEKSDAAHGERDYYSNAFELYGVKDEAAAELLTKNAKVTVTSILKNYHGQVENLLTITADDITVLQEGQPWVIVPIESNVADALTVINGLEDGATTKEYYKISGYITEVRYTWSEKYPTVSFNLGATKDATDIIYVYSLGCTQEQSADFVVGASVTVVGQLQKYVKNETVTPEMINVVEFTVTPPEVTPESKPLPVIAEGNSATRVEGAGIMINLDNTDLGITGANAASIIEASTIELAVSAEKASEAANKDVASQIVIASKQFDDYGPGEATVRLYVVTNMGVDPTWNFEYTVTIKLVIGEDIYEGVVKFLGGVYQPDGGEEPPVEGTQVTFEAVDLIADPDAAYTGGSVKLTSTEVDEVVTVSASGSDANTGKIYKSNDYGFQVRLYTSGNGKIAATVKAGYEIVAATANYVNAGSGWWEAPADGDMVINEAKNEASLATSGANLTVYSVTVTYKSVGGEEPPVELPLPIGNFSGYMVATGDINVFTHVALANGDAYVEVYFAQGNENNIKVQKEYIYDSTTGLVTVELGGVYGNMTATYDPETNSLTNVGVDGAAAAMITNNNEATLTNAARFYNLDGTTEELQATFLRRYRANGASGWSKDLPPAVDHPDRVQSDTTNYIAGTGAMSVRPYSGSGNAVGLSLLEDFETATAYKNIGFWVYNSSDTDISLRTWVYKQTGLNGASEIGGLVAKANGWTYCRMGFDYGAIYNFNISNWNGSSNALVFDNLSLF